MSALEIMTLPLLMHANTNHKPSISHEDLEDQEESRLHYYHYRALPPPLSSRVKKKPLSLTSTLLYKAVLSLFFHKLMIGGGDQYINGTVFMSAASLCVDAVWVIATA